MFLNSIGYITTKYAIKPEINKEAGSALYVKYKEKTIISDIYSKKNEETERALKRLGIKECKTCKQRKYQDASNDPGVSFKSPTHISPELSGAAVAAHENEHVVHEQLKAKEEGKEIIYQSVRIYTSICPECGRVYVLGGKTITISGEKPSQVLNLGLILDQYI